MTSKMAQSLLQNDLLGVKNFYAEFMNYNRIIPSTIKVIIMIKMLGKALPGQTVALRKAVQFTKARR